MRPVDNDFRIKGANVYLRPITAQDTQLVLGWRNSPGVAGNFIYRKQISVAEHMDWLENKVCKGMVHQFVICDTGADTPLGSVYLQNFSERDKKAEEGIFLCGEQAQGKGIGTEAAKLLLRYAFENLDLHKVSARVLAGNGASIRMHEKAGYVREAYFKDELFLDGRYEDLVFLGALRN